MYGDGMLLNQAQKAFADPELQSAWERAINENINDNDFVEYIKAYAKYGDTSLEDFANYLDAYESPDRDY